MASFIWPSQGGGSSTAIGDQSDHAITASQAATDLTGVTFNSNTYSSVVFLCIAIMGTTIVDHFKVLAADVNGTWVVTQGPSMVTDHGIVITVSQATTVGQLRAAETGGNNGTIQIIPIYFNAV